MPPGATDAGGMASQTPIFELAVVKFTTRVEFSTSMCALLGSMHTDSVG